MALLRELLRQTWGHKNTHTYIPYYEVQFEIETLLQTVVITINHLGASVAPLFCVPVTAKRGMMVLWDKTS